jgi:hypothetical protein
MERKENSVVQDVTTKKKYVKPDFEVYELNWEAPLLSASGGTTNSTGRATFGNSLSDALFNE